MYCIYLADIALYRKTAEQLQQVIEQEEKITVTTATMQTQPATKRVVPNNEPSSPSLLGCLFGWLGPFRGRKDRPSAVEKADIPEKV